MESLSHKIYAFVILISIAKLYQLVLPPVLNEIPYFPMDSAAVVLLQFWFFFSKSDRWNWYLSIVLVYLICLSCLEWGWESCHILKNISFPGTYLILSFAFFLLLGIGVFLINFYELFINLWDYPLLVIRFADIFWPVCYCLITLLMVFFCIIQKIYFLFWFLLWILDFESMVFWGSWFYIFDQL